MVTLIIPDVHLKHRIAEEIISRTVYDEIIFLGDYFDDFGDDPGVNKETARWLKNSLKDKKRIHLLGNHDLHYFFDERLFRCSGFSSEKREAIWDALSSIEDVGKLRLFHISQDTLFTHAGLSRQHLGREKLNLNQIAEFLNREIKTSFKLMDEGKLHWLLGPGRARGGFFPIGGINWCDFQAEFVPVEGIKQIFGHTPSSYPAEKDGNWCLDTHLWHYAVVTDGKVEIFEVDRL